MKLDSGEAAPSLVGLGPRRSGADSVTAAALEVIRIV